MWLFTDSKECLSLSVLVLGKPALLLALQAVVWKTVLLWPSLKVIVGEGDKGGNWDN